MKKKVEKEVLAKNKLSKGIQKVLMSKLKY